MTAVVPADQAVASVVSELTGLPAFIAGSSVASIVYSDTVGLLAYSDIDVFTGNEQSLIAAAQTLISNGYTLDERYKRVWSRWLTHGTAKWHTNSLKLERDNIEVNVIYKLVDGHPTTSLGQVIESFDFGLLSGGIDCRDGILRDMRPYFFPTLTHDDALPFLPIRQEAWRNGFISQYQGLREIGRFIKYMDYGYDLSAVRGDLLTGYKAASNYLIDRGDADKVALGSIYQSLAMSIEDNEYDKLREVGMEIIYLDSLDAIMEALE